MAAFGNVHMIDCATRPKLLILLPRGSPQAFCERSGRSLERINLVSQTPWWSLNL